MLQGERTEDESIEGVQMMWMKITEGHTVMIMIRGGGTIEVEEVEEGMRRRGGTSVEDVTIQGALTQYDEWGQMNAI